MTEKKLLRRLCLLLLVFGLFSAPVFAASSEPPSASPSPSGGTSASAPPPSASDLLPAVDIQAKSALLVYAPTGEVLYDHNSHIRREPASITKIMTTLLTLEHAEKDTENGGLDAHVTAKEEDFFDMQDGGSTANIKAGETLRLEDLLYCIMVQSANEACNVAARYVAGSVSAFMEMINERLAKLGCENTHFTNTHGLPDDNHYTTAHDIYLMVQECIQNKTFLKIAHTDVWSIEPTDQTPDGRTLKTTNFLIASNKPDYVYPPARGLKTGSTQAAGHCLASLAEKNNMTLISVVLGAAKEEDTGIVRSFTETRDLFEWGFNNFTTKKLIGHTTVVDKTKVETGVEYDEVELVPASAIEALVPVNLDIDKVERKIEQLYPSGIRAPVNRDQKMGTLTLSYQGKEYGTVDLLANKTIYLDTAADIQDQFGKVVENDWIKYAVIGAGSLVVLYIILVVILNIRRRKRRGESSNYRGSRRRR